MSEIWKNTLLYDIHGEVWLPIYGFENNYQVSNMGRIKSLGSFNHPISIRKPALHKNGYLFVSLWKDNREKRPSIHRLVAIHFVPNPDNKSQVNHKKGIKTDNRASELEWSTGSENIQHSYTELGRVSVGLKGKDHPRSKPVHQLSISNEIIKTFESASDAAFATGLTPSLVVRVCRGTQKTSGGFKWQYA